MIMNKHFREGLSLIEVLIVITIFAVLGVLVTQSVALTLMGSRKSESIVHARENLDYSLNIIERGIRGATVVTPCSNADTTTINYLDQNGNNGLFSCQGTLGSIGSYVASGSASVHLTSNTVKIMSCVFHCYPATSTNPTYVTVDLTMREATASGAQSANVTGSTQIRLRNY